MRIPAQVTAPLGTLIATVPCTCRRIAAIIAGAALALCASGLRADADSDPLRLLVLGDSLTSGYGLPSRASLPARLQVSLEALGFDVSVINAGVSGDTSAGGLARLEWALSDNPHAVIVALGANDALRALDPALTRENLDRLVGALGERDLPVLVAGMLAPRNLGADYAERFDAIYPQLAARHDALLYPFLLDGVAGVAALNQEDGLHPNAAGVEEIVNRILPSVGLPASQSPPSGTRGDGVGCPRSRPEGVQRSDSDARRLRRCAGAGHRFRDSSAPEFWQLTDLSLIQDELRPIFPGGLASGSGLEARVHTRGRRACCAAGSPGSGRAPARRGKQLG